MTPRLLITVDTELSNFPNAQGLWGRVGDEDWGLRRMLDAFEALGIQATFFLDVYAGNDKDLAEQRRAAELIASRGQDLQLHTHPGPAFDRARPRLRDYSFAEQCDIIEFGCQRLQQWTGIRPVLHRAGDWGANHDSLRALRQCGMRADFSASVWSSDCGIDPSAMALNGWTRIDGLLCGVGTCYRDRVTGRMRRVDLEGASFPEVVDILSRHIDPLFLTLHSFSLMRYNRERTRFAAHPEYLDRLQRLCMLARRDGNYQTSSALQAVEALEGLPDAALPHAPLPTSKTMASCAGILKSVRGRLIPAL